VLSRALTALKLLRAERTEPAVLLRAQERKRRLLLSHARARVPLYRDLYAGLPATAPLDALPVVDKALLRAAGEGAWDGPATPADVWISTSGSTGEPYRFPISRAHDHWRKAQYLRPYLTNGRGVFDTVLRLSVVPRAQPWFQRLGLLRELRFDAAASPAVILDALRRTRAPILQGYPSSLRALAVHLATHADAQGGPPPHLRRIFADSELLTPDTRRLVERTLGAPVLDVFGTFETDNIAYQCEAGAGYHVTTDSVVVELLRDGRPVGPGEEGELVVTVLGNLRSPFIRYNLHDVARWSVAPCVCGRSFPTLEVLNGRADDLLLLPGGGEVSAMSVLFVLDGFDRELQHYQLRQGADGACELWVVPAPGAGADLAARLRHAVAPPLAGLPLTVIGKPAIPLTHAGKLRAFVRTAGAAHAQ
jgi:phenylacetate-CoA ligase